MLNGQDIRLWLLLFVLSFGTALVALRFLIPVLTARAAQPIYADGPRWHMKKQGTPTMGGLAFLLALLVVSAPAIAPLLSLRPSMAVGLTLTLLFAAGNAMIGLMDDAIKLIKNRNQGLTAWQKLLLQSILAVIYLMLRARLLGDGTCVEGWDMGIWYYPFAMLAILGTVNCANLTDGVDGLAASVAFAIALSLLWLSAGWQQEVTALSVITVGITLAFLIFNLHPARIFMGDTGSLLLGSLAVGGVFALGHPLLLLFLGSVYLLEGLSVILQVTFFKLTGGRRLFRMAPLHHHLERCGWSENAICLLALALTVGLSVLGAVLLHLW